jgi:arylsulfatase A-like enzyme
MTPSATNSQSLKPRNRCQGIRFLAAATRSALVLATTPADAATILSTDFIGRIVSGKTASNILWTGAGVQAPGDLTWVREGGGPTDTALFDTPNAQGCFAPDMNIDNEGPWSVTIPLAPKAPGILLEDIVIAWQHFSNAGAFQTASRSADWTVSVAGSVSGPLGSVTASNVSGLSGVTTLTFAPRLALSQAETCAVKIYVKGNSGGNNTGLDGLTLNGVISSNPNTNTLRITPAASGFDLAWNSRAGMRYNLRSSSELTGAVSAWPVVAGQIVATPPTNTQSISPSETAQFYAVEEFPAPIEKLNVVILFADDWRYNTLGCAGNPVVRTPNLDRLATQGVRFTHTCVTTAVCWVSRASLYTGQWMARHGRTTTGASITNWPQTFPGLLRSNGYWVGHVGKWHNGAFPAANYDFGRSYYGQHWYTINGSPTHVTQRNEDDALEFLRTRPTNKPFLLTVATFAPHAEDGNVLQYLPQPETTNLYVNVTVPVPVNATDESFQRLPPFIATELNEGRVRWHWRFDTPEKYQTMMKNYYRLCTGVDTMCGQVLAELERQGVLDNTLVIFIGDNGYYHAEHGLADKWYPHQESIRVPLLVRDPRLPSARQGMTNEDFVLNVDLAPTILAAAGIGAPPAMQGCDLAPLYLSTPKPAWRAEFFYEHPIITSTNRIPASEALVRKDWKYFYWPDFSTEQLFGLDADPMEENDRIADPSQAARLAEMRARFAELKAAAQ